MVQVRLVLLVLGVVPGPVVRWDPTLGLVTARRLLGMELGAVVVGGSPLAAAKLRLLWLAHTGLLTRQPLPTNATRRAYCLGMAASEQELIVHDPRLSRSQAVVRGTRIMVSVVLDCFAAGMTEAEILEEYPLLTEEGIRAAAAYGAQLAREENHPARRETRERLKQETEWKNIEREVRQEFGDDWYEKYGAVHRDFARTIESERKDAES